MVVARPTLSFLIATPVTLSAQRLSAVTVILLHVERLCFKTQLIRDLSF